MIPASSLVYVSIWCATFGRLFSYPIYHLHQWYRFEWKRVKKIDTVKNMILQFIGPRGDHHMGRRDNVLSNACISNRLRGEEQHYLLIDNKQRASAACE